MFRIGSLKLSYTRTCPVKSKRSPVFRAKTKFATSAQLVSTAANMAHKKFIGALCQISGIFSSGKGRSYTHPFGCVLYKEGLYCRIDAVALFPNGAGVGELTFLASSRGNVFFNLPVVLILERSCDTICLISIGMPCLEMKSRWWYGSPNPRIDKK